MQITSSPSCSFSSSPRREWLSVDVAALVVLCGLLVGGLVTLEEAVRDSDPAVLTVLR
jgi:hypothetical protein